MHKAVARDTTYPRLPANQIGVKRILRRLYSLGHLEHCGVRSQVKNCGILNVKREHLIRRFSGISNPAKSTIQAVLDRHDLVEWSLASSRSSTVENDVEIAEAGAELRRKTRTAGASA
jgi:hypothetical protein